MVLPVGAGHVHFGASNLLGNGIVDPISRQEQSSQIVLDRWNRAGQSLNLTPLGSRSASRSSADRKRHAFRSTPLKAAIRRRTIVRDGL